MTPKGYVATQERCREQVRYLQDNIIAYQDQGWGDGESLLNYQCSPGVVVDQYRPGHKTYTLISLRGRKQRGDEDEFRIQWELRQAFTRTQEQWETEINHRTRQVRVRIVFPKDRPPIRAWQEGALRHRTQLLDDSLLAQLPDGRWQIAWDVDRPRLHERYVIRWEW